MIHCMRLQSDPFVKIRRGRKTIELRLNDEKRQAVSVGDTIEFSCEKFPSGTLVTRVVALHHFKNFEELYSSLSLEKCGYSKESITSASPEDMKKYYSEESISKWGVLGIEIELSEVKMKDNSFVRPSRFISLVLRHKPEAAGITLDKNGWADTDALIRGVLKKFPIDFETLVEIVVFDDKERYSFNSDMTKIRANQGHSISVDVEFEKTSPPKILYHGTGEKFVQSIEREGLFPRTRLYVHLSESVETAMNVGARHGKPVVFVVDAERMEKDGFEFFVSVNRVWLVKSVPAEYLSKL